MKKIKYILFAISALLMGVACVNDDADNPVFGDKDIPAIYINWQENMILDLGDTISLSPQVSPSDGVTYGWYYDDQLISSEKDLLYIVDEFGEHILDFKVERNGVRNSRTSNVLVLKPFEEKSYNKRAVAYLSKDGSISDVPWNDITHLIVTSSVIGDNGSPDLTLGESELDLSSLISTAHNYGVYVLIEYSGVLGSYINGAPEYASYTFYDAAINAIDRPGFITQLVNFALENSFDGINIYMDKASENGVFSNTEELRNFYEELAAEVPEETSRGKFHLTMSVVAGWTRAALDDVVDIARYDWINILAFAAEDLSPGPHSAFWYFTSEADHWLELGVAPEKIVVGVPAFGLKYTGDPEDYTWGNLWEYTEYIGYRAICEEYPNAPDTNQIAVDNGLFYDGLNEVREKAEYVVTRGLGGLALWTVDNDSKDPGKSLMRQINISLGNE